MSDSLVTAVLERTSDGGRRGRLLAWPRSLAERHPTAARWLRTAWVVWSWLSLALYLVSLVLVPSLREGARPWLWCYWILIVWFLLARTKTLRWRLLALTFSAACVLAPLIGLVEVALARATGMDVNARDGAVLLAGPVEEALKLLPLVGILLLARKRARRLAVVDCLLVGLAAGLGFQAVEDAVRRLALTVNPQGLAGLLATLLHDPNDPAGGYAQYYFWLLPGALFGMVVVDHAMYNADESATGFGGPHDLRVPDWLLWLWRLWGHGLLERPLLVGLLVVALAADVQRLRHVWPLLPPVPELRWASVPAERMRRAVAPPSAHGPAGQPGRRTSRAIALTLRSGADLLSFVLHELALLFLAATGGEQLAGAQAPEGGARAGGQQPAGGPVPAGGHALGGAQAVEAGE